MIGRISTLSLCALLALAACGGGTGSSEAGGGSAVISGLYEGPAGERRAQLCLSAPAGRTGAFGIISWGRGEANCSGSGTIRRDGDRLRLLLDGDESCVIEAQVEGTTVRVTTGLTGECARYYCAGGATIDGATFALSEEGAAAASRAKDLAGDPLCPSD